ncbi:MAG: hypothetical protein H0U89_11550 [Acidimicrobiia bacterium]|nr:hypothetical protein [Acidimicrobiia bacterium]
MEREADAGGVMLLECPTCGRRELTGDRSLVGLRNTPTGIELHLRCRAGHLVVETTGRQARQRAAACT